MRCNCKLCDEIPTDILDVNVFHLKTKFRGYNINKFYDHECDSFFFQCGERRVCCDTLKEALHLFRNYEKEYNGHEVLQFF